VGLDVANSHSSTLVLVRFDADQTQYANPRDARPGWLTADGRHIVWDELRGLVLETLSGEEVGVVPGYFRSVQFVAVAPNLGRVAFEATSTRDGRQLSGLHIATFGNVGFDVVVPEPQVNRDYAASESLGWSPDSQRLVYERSGQIRVLDLRDRTSRTVVAGFAPTWSPDGQRIAYKTNADQAMIIRPDGTGGRALMIGHSIRGFLHWSPDGRYLLFSEHSMFSDRLLVLRLSDGVSVPVYDFGFKGGRDNPYDWVSGYQAFCENCARF
jgi:hypothetical protein